jgi:hypothetical protein
MVQLLEIPWLGRSIYFKASEDGRGFDDKPDMAVHRRGWIAETFSLAYPVGECGGNTEFSQLVLQHQRPSKATHIET